MRHQLFLLLAAFAAGCACMALLLSGPEHGPVLSVLTEQTAGHDAVAGQNDALPDPKAGAQAEAAPSPTVADAGIAPPLFLREEAGPQESPAPGTRPGSAPKSPAPQASIAFFPSRPSHAVQPIQLAPVRADRSPLQQGEPKGSRLPFASAPSQFSLLRLGAPQLAEAPTLLVIGGIQGDEPGGFSAAALLATRYSIEHGQVWVVPDLNFASILERNRGIHGDMNRKFAHLDKSDPEYPLISELKGVLLDNQVDLVLNLHDGSGFYRPTYESPRFNPSRWGQSVIIDQQEMEALRFNRLHHMAEHAQQEVNRVLVHPDHRYFIRNTETRLGDKEMEKSLSYFAVLNGKPAFGIEASKEFTTEYRAYYHLTAIESFMRQMGIAYSRSFELSPRGVLAALNSGLTLAMFNDRVVLPLDNVRPTLPNIPFQTNAAPKSRASRPLLTLVNEKNGWRVAYGNRTLTRVQPATMPFDDSLTSFEIIADGEKRRVRVGEIIPVRSSFTVCPLDEYRVNAIGALAEKNGTEAGVELYKKDFLPRFSVDKDATLYRVEVYKGKAFSGMVLVSFADEDGAAHDDPPLTAVSGPESTLGY